MNRYKEDLGKAVSIQIRRQKENAQKSRQVQAVQEEIDRDFDGRRQRAKDRRPLP